MSTAPNVRSLLRTEISSRRVDHPHASYTNNRSNILSCTVCRLAIKSEALWEGHLRSANHRKNLERLNEDIAPDSTPKSGLNGSSGREVISGARKRKVDEVSRDNDDDDGGRDGGKAHSREDVHITTAGGGRKRKAENDAEIEQSSEGAHANGREERKKSKSQQTRNPSPQSTSSRTTAPDIDTNSAFNEPPMEPTQSTEPPVGPSADSTPQPAHLPRQKAEEEEQEEEEILTPRATASSALRSSETTRIDEDEWAAFERDVIPLSHQNQLIAKSTNHTNGNTTTTTATATNTNITISAPPTTSAPTTSTTTNNDTTAERKLKADEDAELDRLDEAQKLQDEFEVQDEMEQRVKRLRERREQVRELGLSKHGEKTQKTAGEALEEVAASRTGGQEEEEETRDEVDIDGDEEEEEEPDELHGWGFG